MNKKVICVFNKFQSEDQDIIPTGEPFEPFKWNKGIVTYKLTNETGDIPDHHIQHIALSLAFTNWQLHIHDLRFQRVFGNTPADINVSFSKTDPFFTSPGILAYTYLPNPGLPNGEVVSVFNDDMRDIWSMTGDGMKCGEALRLGFATGCPDPNELLMTYNLVETMTHEMGHALGLQHINTNQQNVMQAYYHKDDRLQPEDITAIQHLYGPSTVPQHIKDSFNSILQRIMRLGRYV